MDDIKVISLGGSIVAPDTVDSAFLRQFRKLVLSHLEETPKRKLILVIGGGGPARSYQKAYRDVMEHPDSDAQDWIGIAATRLNAQLLKGIFADLCTEDVVTDPTLASRFSGRILVASGWKPGFSTDYDAVVLAERFGADTVINLSNIAKVYSADPKLDPKAVPLENMSWQELQSIVGTEWEPGKNVPFDPIATKRASELGLRLIVAAGKNIKNLADILGGKAFEGTLVHP